MNDSFNNIFNGGAVIIINNQLVILPKINSIVFLDLIVLFHDPESQHPTVGVCPHVSFAPNNHSVHQLAKLDNGHGRSGGIKCHGHKDNKSWGHKQVTDLIVPNGQPASDLAPRVVSPSPSIHFRFRQFKDRIYL